MHAHTTATTSGSFLGGERLVTPLLKRQRRRRRGAAEPSLSPSLIARAVCGYSRAREMFVNQERGNKKAATRPLGATNNFLLNMFTGVCSIL